MKVVNVSLVFQPKKTGSGNSANKGDYEGFLDMTPSDEGPVYLDIIMPTGYTGQAMNVYNLVEEGGKVQRSADKKADINDLKKPNQNNFSAVFGEGNAAGRRVDGITGELSTSAGEPWQVTVSNTSGDVGWFEFLIWIQDENGNDDFIDPGLKNRGSGGSN